MDLLAKMADPLEFLARLIVALSWLDVEALMHCLLAATPLAMSLIKRRRYQLSWSLNQC
jgi:hypothetical protein